MPPRALDPTFQLRGTFQKKTEKSSKGTDRHLTVQEDGAVGMCCPGPREDPWQDGHSPERHEVC